MILLADREGPDLTARVHKLIRAFAVRISWPKDTFSHGTVQYMHVYIFKVIMKCIDMVFDLLTLSILDKNFSRRHFEIFSWFSKKIRFDISY